MSNQRGGFRFRIPWLGAAPVPRQITTENPAPITSPIAPVRTPVGTRPANSRTLATEPPSGTDSVPVSPPPSPPPTRVPMSPRTVFSPRLIPRSANDQFVTTSQLTQSSPPPSMPASLPSSPNRASPQPSIVSTPPQTPSRYASLMSSPTRAAPRPSSVISPPPQKPLSYFPASSPLGVASPDRKAAATVPELERGTKQEPSPRVPHRQTPEPASKNATQFQTGTNVRPIGVEVGPPLPSEKVVPENPMIVPPKPPPELEKRPKYQTDEGDKKPEKGKGPLKGDKSKAAAPKPEDTRGRTRRSAAYTYTFHGKPSVKTRPPPPPPPPPPPQPPPPPSLQKGIKEDVSKLIHDLTTGRSNKYQIGETLVDMVTLVGENKGAMMRTGSKTSKEKSIHIHREYKTDLSASIIDDEDEDDKVKFNQTDQEEEEESEVEAFVNSNVQGVNNSMVIDSSLSDNDPGVHMTISVADIEEEMSPATENSPETLPETRRAEFNPTISQKLTYDQPMVKRRCLRGLFMESSDSDLDDPTKPRRHGCRYGCGDKRKDKGEGISIP